jgi:alkanesulfonate monooxygenase SsuD/methylene tetrahydromethanopterin reductase-like flavin-dependent oxidoreductase (luciferase family)
VATDWGPIVQTSIGAVAAIGGGFVGSWIQVRYQHRSERDRRRERAAEVLAEARALLTRPTRTVSPSTPAPKPPHRRSMIFANGGRECASRC